MSVRDLMAAAYVGAYVFTYGVFWRAYPSTRFTNALDAAVLAPFVALAGLNHYLSAPRDRTSFMDFVQPHYTPLMDTWRSARDDDM